MSMITSMTLGIAIHGTEIFGEVDIFKADRQG
jgi:hypothetical protein